MRTTLTEQGTDMAHSGNYGNKPMDNDSPSPKAPKRSNSNPMGGREGNFPADDREGSKNIPGRASPKPMNSPNRGGY